MNDDAREVEQQPVVEAVVDDGEGDLASGSVQDVLDEQDRDLEKFAVEFLKKILKLRGVRIERDHFLKAELHRRGLSTAEIEGAVAATPVEAGVNLVVLDDIARSAIEFETRKSSAISFASGLPGGVAMFATVPADVTQFYVHAFRIMQKLAFVYGWHDFLKDVDDVDDETLGMLAAFLGVMMGVSGASTSVTKFATQVAAPAVQKKIANTALTKTAWYLPMKHTLKLVGVQVTKQSFAKSVAKVVPVVGGVVSGGLTFVTLRNQATRLMDHLREIPPPNVNAAQYRILVDMAEGKSDEGANRFGSAVGGVIAGAAARLRSGSRDAGPDAADVVSSEWFENESEQEEDGPSQPRSTRLRRSRS